MIISISAEPPPLLPLCNVSALERAFINFNLSRATTPPATDCHRVARGACKISISTELSPLLPRSGRLMARRLDGYFNLNRAITPPATSRRPMHSMASILFQSQPSYHPSCHASELGTNPYCLLISISTELSPLLPHDYEWSREQAPLHFNLNRAITPPATQQQDWLRDQITRFQSQPSYHPSCHTVAVLSAEELYFLFQSQPSYHPSCHVGLFDSLKSFIIDFNLNRAITPPATQGNCVDGCNHYGDFNLNRAITPPATTPLSEHHVDGLKFQSQPSYHPSCHAQGFLLRLSHGGISISTELSPLLPL